MEGGDNGDHHQLTEAGKDRVNLDFSATALCIIQQHERD